MRQVLVSCFLFLRLESRDPPPRFLHAKVQLAHARAHLSTCRCVTNRNVLEFKRLKARKIEAGQERRLLDDFIKNLHHLAGVALAALVISSESERLNNEASQPVRWCYSKIKTKKSLECILF